MIVNSTWSDRAPALLLIPILGLAIWSGQLSGSQNVIGDSWVTISEIGLAIFFFSVAQELRHEFAKGGLFHPATQALIPASAALGGMLAPALIFLLCARLFDFDGQAWGVTMATDLPVALALLSFLPRLRTVRPFLIAYAIFDDLASILIVAIRFSSHLHLASAMPIIGLVFGLIVYRRGVRVAAWMANYVAIPLFIFVAVAVPMKLSLSKLIGPEPLALILARLIGKPLGITLFALLAIKLLSSRRRDENHGDDFGMTTSQIFSAGLLGALGLTVAILFTQLSLPTDQQATILFVIIATIPCAIAANIVWYLVTRNRNIQSGTTSS